MTPSIASTIGHAKSYVGYTLNNRYRIKTSRFSRFGNFANSIVPSLKLFCIFCYDSRRTEFENLYCYECSAWGKQK